ncbi:hypothetical protein B9H02_05085 [Prosthecochloris sp. HL-130-GSB]|nr:hypothetical protein B9H02_05085 [Prosthecochloris sp. HL-130-GSB]
MVIYRQEDDFCRYIHVFNNDNDADMIENVLIAPLEKVISRIGNGIAEAQHAMDMNSAATQVMIDNDPALSEKGLEAHWYHMPETEVTLKLSLNMKREDTKKNGKLVSRKHRLFAAPLNAEYSNTYNTDISGTSEIRFKVVSIPPPGTRE